MLRRHLLAAAPAFVRSLSAQSRRPNVLFITADDLGLQMSSYGETLIETPHLDRLAGSGVRFQTAYVVQASCSPSRSGMFTGLYPHANGQYGLVNTGHRLHKHLHRATIPSVLKRAGYRTGIIGKLHVAPEETFPFDMRETNNALTREVRKVAAKAAEFWSAGSSDPFFLMVNYSDPHAFRQSPASSEWYFPPQVDGLPAQPLRPGPKTLFRFQQIDTEGQRERTANYYNAIKRLDDGVGMLMSALDKTGQAENTLVMFIGDHGPPFARGKTTCYESGLRIPFVVLWPGVSKTGASPAMVSTVDIAPTIYDAAGVDAPLELHGRSLRDAVRKPGSRGRGYLAGEFHMHGARPVYPRRAIRDDRYKLIHNLLAGKAKPSTGIDGDHAYQWSRETRYDGTAVRKAFDTFADPPEFELYDLRSDPIEFNNLAGRSETTAVERRMKEALHRWRVETKDPCLDLGFIPQLAAPAG
ncbi:MAG: sulfatase [Bryobacteraceae bacterium]